MFKCLILLCLGDGGELTAQLRHLLLKFISRFHASINYKSNKLDWRVSRDFIVFYAMAFQSFMIPLLIVRILSAVFVGWILTKLIASALNKTGATDRDRKSVV